jgi:hypothetical protein
MLLLLLLLLLLLNAHLAQKGGVLALAWKEPASEHTDISGRLLQPQLCGHNQETWGRVRVRACKRACASVRASVRACVRACVREAGGRAFGPLLS